MFLRGPAYATNDRFFGVDGEDAALIELDSAFCDAVGAEEPPPPPQAARHTNIITEPSSRTVDLENGLSLTMTKNQQASSAIYTMTIEMDTNDLGTCSRFAQQLTDWFDCDLRYRPV